MASLIDNQNPGAPDAKPSCQAQVSEDIPAHAKKLGYNFWGIMIAIARLIVSLTFIAFAFAVVYINKKETNGNPGYKRVKEATKLMPTIYPIIFAILIGKAFRDAAVGLAIKGTKLSTIEKLLQFNSAASAIASTLLKFRIPDFLSVTFFVLWSLSPLGGQGALRMLEIRNTTLSNDSSFAYYVLPNATTILPEIFFSSGSIRNSANRFIPSSEIDALYFTGPILDDLFTSSLAFSVRPNVEPSSISRDHVGNVRVPRFSTVDGKLNSEGWVLISESNSSALRYSSFLGIPTHTTSTNKRSSFSIESSYLEFNGCINNPKTIAKDVPNLTDSDESVRTQTKPLWLFNITSHPSHLPDYNDLQAAKTNSRIERTQPQQIVVRHLKSFEEVQVGESTRNETVIIEFICSVFERNVEAIVTCIPETHSRNGQCEITSMRPSQIRPTLDQGKNRYSTILDTVVNTTFSLAGEFEFEWIYENSLLENVLFPNFPYAGSLAFWSDGEIVWSEKNTVLEIREVYQVIWRFWILYAFSSFIMLLSICFSFLYFLFTNGGMALPPHVMEYFDNYASGIPFFDADGKPGILPDEGSPKNLRVRLADVQPNEPFGRIALLREDTPIKGPGARLTKPEDRNRKFV